MVSRGLVLALVAVVSLTLPTPASARGGGGASLGGLHGGTGFHHGSSGFHHGRSGLRHSAFRGGFNRRQGFSRFDCCFGPVLLGNAFLGPAEAAAYYDDYSYPVYPAPPADVPAPGYEASPPPAPPIFCYVGGCYHLRGNGVNVPYQWVWVPDAPAAPPPPPPAAPKI